MYSYGMTPWSILRFLRDSWASHSFTHWRSVVDRHMVPAAVPTSTKLRCARGTWTAR